MFGGRSADKLAAALQAYRRDFEKSIQPAQNIELNRTAALVQEAKDIVRKGGLGAALAPN